MQATISQQNSNIDAKTVFVFAIAIMIVCTFFILESYAQLGLFAITSGRNARTWHYHRQQNRAVVRASAQTLSDMEHQAYERHAPSNATVEPQLDGVALARAECDGVGEEDPMDELDPELTEWDAQLDAHAIRVEQSWQPLEQSIRQMTKPQLLAFASEQNYPVNPRDRKPQILQHVLRCARQSGTHPALQHR
jgi:hypothetical protein